MNRERAIDISLFLLRVTAGYMFLLNGSAKLLGFPAIAYFANLETFSLIWFAGVIELVAGAFILLGVFTRQAAFIASGEMAFAYFLGHGGDIGTILLPNINQGQGAALFCFIFLFLSAYGAGKWSVEGWWKKRKMSSPQAI